jgi:hypothetical protein
VRPVRRHPRPRQSRVPGSAGNIWLERTGPLRLDASAGHVTADGITGNAEISTGSGKVRIGEVEGTAVVKNSNGDTTIDAVTGDVRVRAANGDIRVARAGAGVDAKAEFVDAERAAGQRERPGIVGQSRDDPRRLRVGAGPVQIQAPVLGSDPPGDGRHRRVIAVVAGHRDTTPARRGDRLRGRLNCPRQVPASRALGRPGRHVARSSVQVDVAGMSRHHRNGREGH